MRSCVPKAIQIKQEYKTMDVQLRASISEDQEELVPILHRAFTEFNISVRIPPHIEFGSIESATDALNKCFRWSYGITALDKISGRPIGAGFLNWEGERVQAIGPLFVDPSCSNKGVGKALMSALIDKAKASNAVSIRLGQVAANTKSFSLYAKLGFRPVECVSYFEGSLYESIHDHATDMAGFNIRRMEESDVHFCTELHKNVMGHEQEIDISVEFKTKPDNAWVAIKDGMLQAYTTGFHLFGHSIAISEDALITLFQVVSYKKGNCPMTIHIPGRIYPHLIEWALKRGLQLIRNVWIMVIGDYEDPQKGFIWCPSILG